MTAHPDIDVMDIFGVGRIDVGISRGEKDGEVYYLIAFAGEEDEVPHALTFTEGELHCLRDAIDVASAWIDFHSGRRGLCSLRCRTRGRMIRGPRLGDTDT